MMILRKKPENKDKKIVISKGKLYVNIVIRKGDSLETRAVYLRFLLFYVE